MVPSACRTADLPVTTVGADRLRVKLSAAAQADAGASESKPTAAARANLLFIRAAKLGGGPQRPLNRTSMPRVGEHHRCLDLAFRYVPVLAQQLRRALGSHVLESVPLVEANCPLGGGPGAHENRPRRAREQVLQQGTADAPALALRHHVGVPDQVHVAHLLDAHHAQERAVVLVAPELHSGRDLGVELVTRHVRLVPAVVGDHAAVRLRRGVHDREYLVALAGAATADAHRAPAASSASSQVVTYSIRTIVPSRKVVTWWYSSLSSSRPLPLPRAWWRSRVATRSPASTYSCGRS